MLFDSDDLPRSAEVYKSFISNETNHSEAYRQFVDEVKNTDSLEFKFYLPNLPAEGGDFYEWELEEIEAKGYELYWNGACLWYEVKIQA